MINKELLGFGIMFFILGGASALGFTIPLIPVKFGLREQGYLLGVGIAFMLCSTIVDDKKLKGGLIWKRK